MFKGIGQLLKPGGICLAYGVSIGEPSFMWPSIIIITVKAQYKNNPRQTPLQGA